MTRPARARCSSTSGVEELGVPLLVGRVEHALQAVRRGLVGPEDAEVVRVEPDDVGEPAAQHPGGLGDRRAGTGHVDGVVAEVGQPQVLEQQTAVGVRVVAHPQVRPTAPARRSSGRACRPRRTAPRPGRTPASRRAPAGAPGCRGRWRAEPGVRATIRWSSCRRCSPGPVQPLGVRKTIIGQRAGSSSPVAALRLDLGDLVEHRVEQRGERAVRVGVDRSSSSRLEEVRVVAVADHQAAQLVARDAVPARSDWRSCSR